MRTSSGIVMRKEARISGSYRSEMVSAIDP